MTYGNYPDLTQVKRILVVKMRHLGDVLLTSPLFTLLHKGMPEAQIDAYIYEESLPMLEGHPGVDNFLLYDRKWKKLPLMKRLKKEMTMLRRVRQGRYDMVINLTEGDRGALIARFSGAPIRVGFDPGKKGFLGKSNLYTHIVKKCHQPRHMVERHLDVVRCLGIFPRPEERELFLHVDETHRQKVKTLLGDLQDFLVIHPVSRWMFKCPLPEFYVDLIKKIGEKVVLTSGPGDKERAFVAEIVNRLPDGSVLDLSGRTSLKELAALLQLSRGLITVDSVPLHMASALKTPVVALFGPSSEIDWGPWRNPHSRVIAQNYSCRPCGRDGCGGSKLSDCLYTLKVDQVLEALPYSLKSSPK